MSNYDNKDAGADPEGNPPAGAADEQLSNSSRRRFSRTALAGSAVLLSLGNRTAWGQTVVGCMSVATLNSFDPATGMFQSAPGGRLEHNETLATEIHYVSAPNDGNYIAENVVGTDGSTVYSTCQDQASLDGICLVEDDTCTP